MGWNIRGTSFLHSASVILHSIYASTGKDLALFRVSVSCKPGPVQENIAFKLAIPYPKLPLSNFHPKSRFPSGPDTNQPKRLYITLQFDAAPGTNVDIGGTGNAV